MRTLAIAWAGADDAAAIALTRAASTAEGEGLAAAIGQLSADLALPSAEASRAILRDRYASHVTQSVAVAETTDAPFPAPAPSAVPAPGPAPAAALASGPAPAPTQAAASAPAPAPLATMLGRRAAGEAVRPLGRRRSPMPRRPRRPSPRRPPHRRARPPRTVCSVSGLAYPQRRSPHPVGLPAQRPVVGKVAGGRSGL